MPLCTGTPERFSFYLASEIIRCSGGPAHPGLGGVSLQGPGVFTKNFDHDKSHIHTNPQANWEYNRKPSI